MSRASRQRKSARQAIVAACESLETRRMFVTYHVTGTNGDNAISISIDGNNIISVVDGVSDSASDIINNNIEINGMGGNDTISITETGNNTVVVFAGSGNDTINLAIGSNNLGAIDGNVTVHGEGGDDKVVFWDSTNSAGATYNCTSGNHFSRTNMADVTVDTEHAEVKPGSGDDFLVFADPPFADYVFNGQGGTDSVNVSGAAGESITYRTGGQSGGSGSFDFPSTGSTVEFFSCPSVKVFDMPTVKMISTYDDDSFDVGTSGSLTKISGVSGIGVVSPPADLLMDNVTTCIIDLGTNDGVQPGAADDTLDFNVHSPDNTLFLVDLGGGANVLNVNADTNLDTRVGFAAGQFNAVTVNGATATFEGLQTPQSLTLKNAAVAQFNGTGTVLSTPTLSVPVGSPSLRITSGQTGAVTSAFSITAGQVLQKTGNGTFNVTAAQSHGAAASFNNSGGTTNFSTDCGSASARTLNLFGDFGNINLNTTQHVRSVDTNFGNINVGANGSRVLVTTGASIGGEGGLINLNDNDMVFDYASGDAAADNAVRALLHTGRNNGNWNGLGIVSNTAASNPLHNTTLGFMEATEYALVNNGSKVFDGQTLDTSALVVKYTYYGDTNFSGRVTFDDYVRTDIGFNQHLTGWINGDFNDSGTVNFDDYVLIDSAFNNQGAVLGRTSLRVREAEQRRLLT